VARNRDLYSWGGDGEKHTGSQRPSEPAWQLLTASCRGGCGVEEVPEWLTTIKIKDQLTGRGSIGLAEMSIGGGKRFRGFVPAAAFKLREVFSSLFRLFPPDPVT
jgi:hypothetical protein